MGKIDFKPGNMLYPLPAVLVTVRDRAGKDNVFTVAWAGTVCTNPPMLSISVRPERHSYKALHETGEFVVNLTGEEMVRAVDFCGVRSGRNMDKFACAGLAGEEARKVNAASLRESPVNIECRVREEIPLGSHHLFLADVVHVTVDEKYMDEKGTFHLDRARPLVYSHGAYFAVGRSLGSFGFSVRKKRDDMRAGMPAGKKGSRGKISGRAGAKKRKTAGRPGRERKGGRTAGKGEKDRTESGAGARG